jgi:serine/threonine protein phosphatase PrpC
MGNSHAPLHPSRRTGGSLSGRAPHPAGIRFGLDQNIGASPKRRLQEDACFAGTVSTSGGLTVTLGIVADGIGGEASGERASTLAVENIVDFVRQSNGRNFPQILEGALRSANAAVFSEAEREEAKRHMGSTATAAIIHRDRLYLASVGDSCAYLVRGGKVIQLTSDHNWGREMIRKGLLPPEEALRHPRAAALVRSIGAEPDVSVDLGLYWNAAEEESAAQSRQGTALQPGDNILLCSDGLIKERPDRRGHFVEPEEFSPILVRNDPQRAAQTLVSKALGRNVNDNVTVVVLQKPAARIPSGGGILLRGIVLTAIAGFALLTAVAVPGLISQIQSRSHSPAPGSLRVASVTGNVLFMESGRLPVPLHPDTMLPAVTGGTLQTLEGTVQILLPDSSRVYLDRFSKVRFGPIADPSTEIRNTVLALEEGRVLISASLPRGFTGTITSGENLRAQALGSLLGAAYLPGTSRLEVDCLEGSCLLVNSNRSLSLAGGQYSWVDEMEMGTVGEARYELWAGLAGSDPAWVTPTAIPSPTQTATPSSAKRPPDSGKPTDAPHPGPQVTDTPTPETPVDTPTDNPATALPTDPPVPTDTSAPMATDIPTTSP